MILREHVTRRSDFYSVHHSHDGPLRELANFQPIMTFGFGRFATIVRQERIRLSGRRVSGNRSGWADKATL